MSTTATDQPAEPATSADPKLPTVAIITTGGTIAQKYDEAAGGLVPAVSGQDLVEAVPELRKVANLEVLPLVNIDSRQMSPEIWLRLARLVNEALERPEVAGVVVTHGTDTMEDSAWLLELTVGSDKPVVLTGAMRGADARDADGPRNLLNSVRQVVNPQAGGLGVTVDFGGQIYAARAVSKYHTNHPDAFGADIHGQVGEVDDERVVWFGRPRANPTFAVPEELPRVELVYCYPGADGSLLDAAVRLGAQGVVVCGYGIGNVNDPMYAAIRRAREAGVAVVLTSRVRTGRVYPVYGGVGGGGSLRELGVVLGNDLLPWKARVLLMLGLSTTSDPAELQGLFGR